MKRTAHNLPTRRFLTSSSPEPTRPPLFEPIESEASRWRSWAPALLVTILILVFGGAALAFLGSPESLAQLLSSLGTSKPESVPLDSKDLGLEVALDGDALNVSWNKDAATVANAERGSLSIWDGESKREVDLFRPQLRTGGVQLPHATNRVSVRLQLVGTNGEIGDSDPVTPVEKPPAAPPSGSTAETRDRIPTIEIDPPPSQRARGSGSRTESSGRNPKSESARPSRLALARATTTPPPPPRPSSTRPGSTPAPPSVTARPRSRPGRPRSLPRAPRRSRALGPLPRSR